MSRKVGRSDIKSMAVALTYELAKSAELDKRTGLRYGSVLRALLKGMAKTGTSQFTGDTTGIVYVKPNVIKAGLPREFWAWKNGRGWSASLTKPDEPGEQVEKPLIPVHHHSLVKWAGEQKNLDLVQQAIDIENRREKPRPTVIAALDKALHKYDMGIN